jgi:hypothetical protein
MALHDGKRVLRDSAGKLYKVAPGDAERIAKTRGWAEASDDEVRARADALQAQEQYGGAGQTALATVEKAARTASGNLLPMQGAEKARAKVLDDTSPVLSFTAQAAGSLLPAAGIGKAVGALGAGKAAIAAAEGLAAGYADEAEMARAEERPISPGNVMLFGIGGELAGRALPALLRRGVRGVSAGTGDAASVIAGETVGDVSVAAQKRATDRMAREAANMRPSPERGALLKETAPQQYERAGTALSESLTEAATKTAKLESVSDRIVTDLVAEDSPAQMKWSTDTAMLLDDMARAGDGFADDPRGIVSKSGRRAGGTDWKGPPKEAERIDRQIDAYKDDPEFRELLEQKAAETRRTPFGPGKERELWELQKDVLEENGKRFPRVKGTDNGARAPLDDVQMLGSDGMLDRVSPKSKRMRAIAPQLDKLRTEGIAGKSIEDLRALPIDDPAFPQATEESRKKIAWMRDNETFRKTGKLPNERDNSRGGLPSLNYEGDTAYINNGRHRITAAREAGLDELVMNVKSYDAEGNTLWDYVGPVRINPRKAAPAMPAAAAPAVAGYTTMREVARQLLEAKGGADTFKTVRRGLKALEEAGAPPEAVKALRDGLAQRELWGRAAEFQDDLQRATQKHQAGMTAIAPELDPKRLSQMLELDPAERGQFGAKLQEAVEGLEDQISVARKWGLAESRGVKGLGKLLARAKRALSLAEATAATKAPRLPSAAPQSATRELGGEVLETIVDMGIGAMGLPPVAGLAMKAGRRIWQGLGDKGTLAMKNAARQFVRPLTDESLDTVRSVAAASAISRFTGEYSGPQEAFAARAKMLDQLRANPTALPLALAESLGTLPQDDPKLFSQIAARVQSQVAYVDANLPPGIAVSVRYPRGMPPSQMALRDYAVLWNSTFYPDTVLDDLAMGTASPTQMRVLRDVHPDIYSDLQSEVMFEAASAFETIRPQTLNQLDILFETDGLAGPSFSWRAAGYIAESREEYAQRAPGAASGPTATADQLAPDAGSIHAIKSGVTNRGA